MSALVSTMTPLTASEARDLTDHINATAGELWVLLMEAYNRRAWVALGYSNWRDYATAEFNMSKSHAYRLLDQARVITAIQEAAGDDFSPIGEISLEASRDIKPALPEVTKEIRARVERGEEPTEAVRQVVEQKREERKAAKSEPATSSRPAPPENPAPPTGDPRRMLVLIRAAIDASYGAEAASDADIAAIQTNDMMIAGLRKTRDLIDRVIRRHEAGTSRVTA